MRWTTKPWDLAAAVGLLLVVDALALAGVGGPLRVALALPALLLVPGWLLTAALFPARHRVVEVRAGEAGEEETRRSEEGLDALERLALSVGLSIAVVPLVGLLLNVTPWGVRLAPLLAALTLFALGAALVAWRRRAALAPEDRFQPEVRAPKAPSPTPLGRALTVGLALAVVAAGAALAYVLATPREAETFTEFYVLAADGRAEGYPSNLTVGEEARVRVGIVNHEGGRVVYGARLVAERGQLADDAGNATFRPAGNVTLSEWSVALEESGRWEEEVAFRLAEPGLHRVRLELEKPGAPAPYRTLHLYVDVTD